MGDLFLDDVWNSGVNYKLANGNNERQMFTSGDGEFHVREDVFHFPSVGKDSRWTRGKGNAGYLLSPRDAFRKLPFATPYLPINSRQSALTFLYIALLVILYSHLSLFCSLLFRKFITQLP